MRDLLELDDGGLRALAANAAVTEAFPHLTARLREALTAQAKTCGTCVAKQERARNAVKLAVENLALALVAMAPADRNRLKAILDARQLRIVAGRNHEGLAIRHTL